MRASSIFSLACLLPFAYGSPPLRSVQPIFESSEEIISKSRLPDSFVPNFYSVELQIILDEGKNGTEFTAPGKVAIHGACLRPMTDNITLHALGLDIKDESIKVWEYPLLVELEIVEVIHDLPNEQFTIKLSQALRAGQTYRIQVDFVAPISRHLMIGLYASNYTDDNGQVQHLAVTDLEATDARRVFPCFDEPHLKAIFDVSVIYLPKYNVLSNMEVIRTEDAPDHPGWKKDTFNRTEIMSTYLFAIAVSDFVSEEAKPGLYRKPVQVWGPPPLMRAGAGSYSPDVTARLLTAMEDYFQVPYTFPKMDKIACPHFLSGAMENWGLNTYRLNRLLLETGIATTADKVSATITLSHELIHQWFGNLVTMEWWSDLWLNEGFASYYSNTIMQQIGMEDMLPLDTLVSDAVQRAMAYDVSNDTHPVHYGVDSSTEIRIMFDTITYSKGAALVRMMETMLGEPNMRAAITAYLKKHQYANAHQDDLFNTLDEEIPNGIIPTHLSLKSIMQDWTLQTGFPVVSVNRVQGSGLIFFKQEMYTPEKDMEKDVNRTWNVPISFQLSTDSGLDTSTKLWLYKNESSKTHIEGNANFKWIVVNPKMSGYYRVVYTASSQNAIIEQLHSNHTVFDPQTRSALIDDNLNLAFGGHSSLSSALNLTLYLTNERHLVPWTSFLNNMAKLYRFLLRSSSGNPFKKYIFSLVKETLQEIKLEPQPSEPIGNAAILRTKLFEWACNLQDADCIKYSVDKFALWMNNPSNPALISPDLRPSVFCTAVANGDVSHWDFAFQQYHLANREVTKLSLIRSLGCTKSVFTMNRLMDLAIDPSSGIDDAHRVIAFQAVAGNSVGVEVAFNFLRNRLTDIIRRYGTSFVGSVITTLSSSMNTDFNIADLSTFGEKAELGTIQGTIQSALNTVHSNVRWWNRNEDTFKTFLNAI